MREKCFDRRHIEFSKLLGCSAELVEEAFLQVGVDNVPSRQDAHDLKKSIEIYGEAAKYIGKAVTALEGLSTLQKSTHQITNVDLVRPLKTALEEVISWKVMAEQEKAKFRSNGPSNENAYKLAEFVAVIFDMLGMEVTCGTYPDTSEPSTKFGVAVKRAIEVYRMRQPSIVRDVNIPRADGLVDTFKLRTEGELIWWRRPAEIVCAKRKNLIPNKR